MKTSETALRILEEMKQKELTYEELMNITGLSRREVTRYIQDFKDKSLIEERYDLVKRSRVKKFSSLDPAKHIIRGGFENQTLTNAASAVTLTPMGSLVKGNKNPPKMMTENLKKHLDVKGQIDDYIFKDLFYGTLYHHFVNIKYQKNSDDGINEYQFCPLKLYIDFGFIYAAGFDKKRRRIILLNAHRIISAVRDRNNVFSKHSRHLDYINSAWGKMITWESKIEDDYPIQIEFETTSDLYRLIWDEKRNCGRLHSSQKVVRKKETGWYIFRMKIHNELEFNRWAFRFGTSIRVTYPQKAVDHMKKSLEEMLQYYSFRPFV